MPKHGLRDLAAQLEAVAREHPNFSQVTTIVDVFTGYINAMARIAEINQGEAQPNQTIEFDYTNYRGEQSHRKARILAVRWGTSDWHPEAQWLLMCWDLAKDEFREFAMKDMTNLKQEDRRG